MRALCRLDDVAVVAGHQLLLEHASLAVGRGDRIGVLESGPGRGHTALLDLVAGVGEPSSGRVERASKCTVAAFPLPPRPGGRTVAQLLADAARGQAGTTRPAAHRQRRDAAAEPDSPDALARALGCPAGDRPEDTLTDAERQRLDLACVLLAGADLLVLDNPTRCLDIDGAAWLGRYLRAGEAAVLLASHDRHVLDLAVDTIVEIDRGRLVTHPGNYTDYVRAGAGRHGADELRWLAADPARRRRLAAARLEDYDGLETRAYARRPGYAEITIPLGPPLDEPVLAVRDLGYAVDGVPVVDGLSCDVPRGAIVGVVGPAGTGRTALLELLAGRRAPDRGAVEAGPSVERGYVAYADVLRDPEQSPWQLVCGGRMFFTIGARQVPSRPYLSSFGLPERRQLAPLRELTPAERHRVLLAATFRQGGNVLFLDEPGYGLEVDMLTALEEALLGFAGTVVLTTHDRWLLDRVATHTLAWAGDASHPARWPWQLAGQPVAAPAPDPE